MKAALFVAAAAVVSTAILPSTANAGDLFGQKKHTPEIIFDYTGSYPSITLRKTNGLGAPSDQLILPGGDITLVPGSSFIVRVIGGGNPKIYLGHVGGTSLEQKLPARVNLTPSQVSLNGQTHYLVNDPKTLMTLQKGTDTVNVEARSDGQNQVIAVSINVLPADRWSFAKAFQPYTSIARGTDFGFGTTNTLFTFGNNSNLSLDTVAVFTPGSKDESGFLGTGLSYTTFLGSQFKTSGKPFFGFPLRLTLTLGFRNLSFENHVKGDGSPFFGFGIGIPMGG